MYGAPVVLGSGLDAPFSVALDKNGRRYALDLEYVWQLAP